MLVVVAVSFLWGWLSVDTFEDIGVLGALLVFSSLCLADCSDVLTGYFRLVGQPSLRKNLGCWRRRPKIV
jgi:hypothetical protein